MENNHNSRFTDGLLLGVLIGGAAVFLLGTEKGKKVLKIIREEGLDGFSEIAREMENGAKKEAKVHLQKVEERIGDFKESIEAEGTNGNGHKSPGKRFFRKPSPKN